ncbi:amidase signature domain-containing protein [Aspergillus ambiguus]|uniref:amidase family protein n=1 Tax=Aspergillus ambiguus TaxID=176160 RepID=UPI003CCD3C8D
MRAWRIVLLAVLGVPLGSDALPRNRNVIKESQRGPEGILYELGVIPYFANSRKPYRSLGISDELDADGPVPLTVIVANESEVTAQFLEKTISRYLSHDDVMSADFMANIYLSTSSHAEMDSTAVQYLQTVGADRIFVNSAFSHSVTGSFIRLNKDANIPLAPGPYTAVILENKLNLLSTYRLYKDEHRDFITGMYASNDGTGSFRPFQSMSSKNRAPMIPVPSRIHSWSDARPLAGIRVAVKDLFNVHGLQTSAGSQAWIQVMPIAQTTAPSIQRLVDLGAVLVGKYKLAQFASGADPWQWIDEQYPFNPRGDGYLTCSASSSGGGCSVAAYDWLDAAIGSDTGSSIRRPAAVSGTFGNRPSQGIISMEGVAALNWAQDTAGVFARDPISWSRFAKAWYTPELHQNSSITGLTPLHVPDTTKFPSRILYPDDYFPMRNPAAQKIVDSVISQMSALFNMEIHHFNFTATVTNATIYPDMMDPWDGLMYSSSMLTNVSHYIDVAGPLMSEYKRRYEGRFPPVDPVWRTAWKQLNMSSLTRTAYEYALKMKATGVDWFEKTVLYETQDSCSESLMLCDIGTGGLPSFREKELNTEPNATGLSVIPDGTVIGCATICPLFGCADFTIPIGQVPYMSPVTMVSEQWPVSLNFIVRRGCDFMLFNMVEKMAHAGMIGPVKTGRTAF